MPNTTLWDQDITSEPSMTGPRRQNSPWGSSGSRVNRNDVQRQGDFITRSSSGSQNLRELQVSRDSWEADIGRQVDRLRQMTTSTRTPRVSPELGSNSVVRPSGEMSPTIGIRSNLWPFQETLEPFRGTYIYGKLFIKSRYYNSLTRIAADNAKPVAMERTAFVFWGKTGSGKSLRAWTEAGENAYSKDPRTKWWCGYKGETDVIIDEFRGSVDVSHILRWLDRYPVTVEIKGGSRPLAATRFWITSNLDPRAWYPEIDSDTLDALLRRLNITHFN